MHFLNGTLLLVRCWFGRPEFVNGKIIPRVSESKLVLVAYTRTRMGCGSLSGMSSSLLYSAGSHRESVLWCFCCRHSVCREAEREQSLLGLRFLFLAKSTDTRKDDDDDDGRDDDCDDCIETMFIYRDVEGKQSFVEAAFCQVQSPVSIGLL